MPWYNKQHLDNVSSSQEQLNSLQPNQYFFTLMDICWSNYDFFYFSDSISVVCGRLARRIVSRSLLAYILNSLNKEQLNGQ